MGILLRPTIPSDLAELLGGPLPWRARCRTALSDGKVIGIGGIGFDAHGAVAFIRILPEARDYPVALHRAALLTLQDAREMGLARVVAIADPTVEAAERWLVRLGFVPEHVNDRKVFVWRTR